MSDSSSSDVLDRTTDAGWVMIGQSSSRLGAFSRAHLPRQSSHGFKAFFLGGGEGAKREETERNKTRERETGLRGRVGLSQDTVVPDIVRVKTV